MSLRIRAHVDYGRGPGPKPRAPRPIIVPETPEFKYRDPTRIRRTVTRDDILNYLRDASRRGARCPSCETLGELFNHSANQMMLRLARDGFLTIYVYGKNWRVVEIDGFRTKEAPSKTEPYMRVSIDGVEYKHGNQWIRK